MDKSNSQVYNDNQCIYYKVPEESCCRLWVLVILCGSLNDIDEAILKVGSFICRIIRIEKGLFQYLWQMSYL